LVPRTFEILVTKTSKILKGKVFGKLFCRKMLPVKNAKCNKNQLFNDNLENLGVHGVMNGVASTNSDGRSSVSEDSRIGDDIVLQNEICNIVIIWP
jgi:hypothetical protein